MVYKPKAVISAGRFTLTEYGIVHDVFSDAQSFKTTSVGKTLHPRPEDRDIINRTLHFGPWDYGLTLEDLEELPDMKKVFNG